jgi:hypothetical protein
MLVKTDKTGFVKNTTTGAIINTDDDAYKKFLAARNEAETNKNLSIKMKSLELELIDIKKLLLQIVNGKN